MAGSIICLAVPSIYPPQTDGDVFFVFRLALPLAAGVVVICINRNIGNAFLSKKTALFLLWLWLFYFCYSVLNDCR